MANYDLITTVFGLCFFLAFGFLGWMFVHEAVRQAWDAWRTSRLSAEERAELEAIAWGPFSLRRADSELRSRHVHKVKITGRTSEINKRQDDPYDP